MLLTMLTTGWHHSHSHYHHINATHPRLLSPLPPHQCICHHHHYHPVLMCQCNFTPIQPTSATTFVLRSLSYNLARKARSCPARSFAVGSTLSSDLTFSQPAIVNSDANPVLCLVFSGQGLSMWPWDESFVQHSPSFCLQ